MIDNLKALMPMRIPSNVPRAISTKKKKEAREYIVDRYQISYGVIRYVNIRGTKKYLKKKKRTRKFAPEVGRFMIIR